MQNKGRGGGQWGITWKEVGASIEEYEASYSCRLEHGVLFTSPHGKARYRSFVVSCRAISGRAGAYRLEGYAECPVGPHKGAASFPGAFLRTIIDACEDLAKRRADPRHNRDNPVPDRS